MLWETEYTALWHCFDSLLGWLTQLVEFVLKLFKQNDTFWFRVSLKPGAPEESFICYEFIDLWWYKLQFPGSAVSQHFVKY